MIIKFKFLASIATFAILVQASVMYAVNDDVQKKIAAYRQKKIDEQNQLKVDVPNTLNSAENIYERFMQSTRDNERSNDILNELLTEVNKLAGLFCRLEDRKEFSERFNGLLKKIHAAIEESQGLYPLNAKDYDYARRDALYDIEKKMKLDCK